MQNCTKPASPSDLMWIMTGDGVPPHPPAFSTAILHRDAVTSGGQVGAVGGLAGCTIYMTHNHHNLHTIRNFTQPVVLSLGHRVLLLS